MKKTVLLSLFCFSTANAWAHSQSLEPNMSSDEKHFLSSLTSHPSTSNKHQTFNETVSGNENQNFARMGDGYRTMASEFTIGTLFQNVKSNLVPSGASYAISFQDDLSEEKLRHEMGLEVSGTVPIKEVVLSPALNYTRKAGKTRLSRTTTLIANAKLGTLKIQGNKDQGYTVANSAAHLFDEDGVLKDENIGQFYKLYGDSAVVSQELVGKLFVTVKMKFDSENVLNDFMAKVGGSVAGLMTNSDTKLIEVNAKLTYLSENIKNRTSLTLIATQLGGVPKELSALFDTPSTCSLAKLEPCQEIIKRLNEYVSKDYREQLKIDDPSTWYAESLIVAPYDTLNLVSADGKPFSVQNTLDPLKNIYISDLISRVNRDIKKEIRNHNIALDMLSSKDLAQNEVDQAKNILDVAENNYRRLKGFAAYCYSDLLFCLQNSDELLNTLVKPYETDMLNNNVGEMVARVETSYAPLSGQKHRSSNNFFKPTSMLFSGKYASFYLKLKSIDNNLVHDNYRTFDVTCDIPWYRGFDQDIIKSGHSGFTISNASFAETFNNLCEYYYDDSIYIRNPVGVSYPGMVVEIWGRD